MTSNIATFINAVTGKQFILSCQTSYCDVAVLRQFNSTSHYLLNISYSLAVTAVYRNAD